jgi:hypothetical protein
MTAASYSWPRYNILANGTMTGSTGWTTTSGSPDFSVSGYASLDQTEGIRQDHKLAEKETGESDCGRWIPRYEPLKIDITANRVSGVVDGGAITVLMRKSGEDFTFFYNFHTGDWEPSSAGQAEPDNDKRRYYFGWDSSDTDTSTFHLPKIWPVSAAGKNGEVDDTWLIRVIITNDSSATGVLRVHNIRLSLWGSDVRTAQIGSTTVITNNRNFPVKYDAKSGKVTELSLNGPYQMALGHAASNMPVVAVGSGGLFKDNFYGFAFTFMNSDTGEESPPPFGRFSSSSYFTEEMTSAPGGFTLNFDEAADAGKMLYPDAECADQADGTDDGVGPSGADNTNIDKIVIYRTAASADAGDTASEAADATDQSTVEDLLYNGLAYFDGVVAKGGTYTSDIPDEDLYKRSSGKHMLWNTQIPAPAHTYNLAFRNRLFTAGGPAFDTGSVTVTNGSHFVAGLDRDTATLAPTVWNRSVENMLFQVDGEADVYQVERYIYPDDDTTGSTQERLYLTTPYKGSTAVKKFYRIWPEGGRVSFSEEGTVWRFDAGSYFLVDGGKGEPITGIGSAGNVVLAFTRKTSSGFAYDQVPTSNDAQMISNTVGSVSHDSFVEIEGAAYWLSDRGVIRYQAGGAMENLSAPIMGMFSDPSDKDYVSRTPDTQLASVAVAAHYAARNQYLLAVKTESGRQGANVVLAYNYVLNTWDILRLDCELVRWIPSVDDTGRDVLMFTNTTGDVYRWDTGLTDGAGEVTLSGTLKGPVTAATATTLTDSNAEFFVASDSENFSQYNSDVTVGLGLDGAWVRIVSGTGAGQKRSILRNIATQLFLSNAWAQTPDTTSAYEIGGIDAAINFKASNIGVPGRIKRLKKVNLDLKTEGREGRATIKAFRDFQVQSQNENKGIANRTFTTGEGGRLMVGMDEAAGYNMRISLEANGPKNPIQIRTISAAIEIGETD